MQIVHRPEEVRRAVAKARARGLSIGLVPTMGYLHEGHATLMRRAREETEFVVVSIFVNPTQFAPGEDLERYPRDLEGDCRLLEREGVGLLYHPGVEGVYPEGFQTTVRVGELSLPLCGATRPGHFEGVATVVLKLFNTVMPDVAFFGEKDYQQLQVIRRMVCDLDLPLRIQGVPTVREADGLAMSSRNAYLSAEERTRARSLSRALGEAEAMAAGGERDAETILRRVRETLAAAGVEIQYAELRDTESLQLLGRVQGRALLALAGYVGKTRLIDNRVIAVSGGTGERM